MKKKLSLFLAVLMAVCGSVFSFAEDPPELRAGGFVRFGHYEQDNDLSNGPEEIEWLVLDVQDGKALLLSRYGLDRKPYNTEDSDVTWETCTLRKWMNGEFLNTAFSEEELAAVLPADVDNSGAQGFGEWTSVGGNNTRDMVFLLSYEEAHRFFGITLWNKIFIEEAQAAVTAYAYAQGTHRSDYPYKNRDREIVWDWWLRSPGYSQDSAATVGDTGALFNIHVGYDSGCVRPAVWLNTESEIFRAENRKTVPESSEKARQEDQAEAPAQAEDPAAGLAGTWTGTIKEKKGNDKADLTLRILDSGEATLVFSSQGQRLQFPCRLRQSGTRLDVGIPSNYAGLKSIEAGISVSGGIMEIDMTVNYSRGGSRYYSGSCRKQ